MSELQILERILPRHLWILVAIAGVLLLVGVVLMLVRQRHIEHWRALRARAQKRRSAQARDRRPRETEGDGRRLFARLETEGKENRLLRCTAELLERRPLSEAQWDSPVPAAWTIFRLTPEEAGGPFHLGLLLPVQHPQAYSAGYLERLETTDAGALLRAFSLVLGGPVPGPAITGCPTGFLEFKTYIDNERPDVLPGSLELARADYWIYVKVFVQDTMEFHVRLNAATGRAEFASSEPSHGEELMRVLAATLRLAD